MRYRYRIEPTPCSAGDAGAGVRVRPGGVQRRAASPRRGIPRRGEAVGQRDPAPGDHSRPRPPPSGRGWPRCPAWRWCSRSTTRVEPGATSSTLAPGSEGRKLGRPRMKSTQGPPAVVSADPQRIQRPRQRPAVCGEGWRGAGALVACALPSEPSSVTIIRGTGRPLLREFRRRCATPAPLPVVAREAGMDVGIARLATIATTDGARTDIANPKHLGRKLRKLRRLEREKSRRQKGSSQQATRRGARSPSRTTRWRAVGGTITTSRLWRWFARTK